MNNKLVIFIALFGLLLVSAEPRNGRKSGRGGQQQDNSEQEEGVQGADGGGGQKEGHGGSRSKSGGKGSGTELVEARVEEANVVDTKDTNRKKVPEEIEVEVNSVAMVKSWYWQFPEKYYKTVGQIFFPEKSLRTSYLKLALPTANSNFYLFKCDSIYWRRSQYSS
uniref:Uncharacterized protein n=1 Tax=Ditylenchus dipsaci TaxID=166011 RepID=A0A915EWC0_9BILA